MTHMETNTVSKGDTMNTPFNSRAACRPAHSTTTVGSRVEVFRGDTRPHGTIGTLAWKAYDASHWGIITALVQTDDGDVFFIDIADLKVVK